ATRAPIRQGIAIQLLLLQCRHPAQSDRYGGVVKLTLVRIDRASGIEPEDLVGKVETRGYEFQLSVHAVAALDIDLRVCVKVLISQGTLDADDGIIVRSGARRIMCILIDVNVGRVVTHRKTPGEAGLVVSKAH